MEMTTVTVDPEHLAWQPRCSTTTIMTLKSTAEFQKRRKGLKQTIKRRERTLAKQVASRKPRGTSRNAQRGTPPDEEDEDEEAVEEDLNEEQRLEQEVDEPENTRSSRCTYFC